MKTHVGILAAILATALGLAACEKKQEPAPAADAAKGQANAKVKEARQIAEDAYTYGYSLITTEVTRIQMSNVRQPEGMHAPMGQFTNIKRYPPADYRGVSAPNADTLYSLAWVDLTEPQVFSHPDMGKRFYLFEMIDLWMTISSRRAPAPTGGKAANYLHHRAGLDRRSARPG